MSVANFTVFHALSFVMRAVQRQAHDDGDVLWAENDFVHIGASDKAEDNCFQMTLRENLDGAGRVKCYLISIKEIEP